MTWIITAYNNKRTMIIQSETRTNDKDVVDIVKDFLEFKGWYVTVREEA